jgi:hypothetical protein
MDSDAEKGRKDKYLKAIRNNLYLLFSRIEDFNKLMEAPRGIEVRFKEKKS